MLTTRAHGRLTTDDMVYPIPGRPMDTIMRDPLPGGGIVHLIDFALPPWVDFFNRLSTGAQTRARSAALNAGPPAHRVPVNPKWFDSETWDSLMLRPSKGNAMIIAARGQHAQYPCAKLCAKKPEGTPFRACIVLPGHWENSCANCKVRDWGMQCDHHRQ